MAWNGTYTKMVTGGRIDQQKIDFYFKTVVQFIGPEVPLVSIN